MADYPYRLDGELIIVPVRVHGKSGTYNGMFVLDTGSSGIIIDHEIALDIGYSAIDGIGRSSVSSAAGREEGYRLMVKKIESIGKNIGPVEVRCHDLKDQGVEGLIGMTFLKHFDWCVHPQKQVVSTGERNE